MQTPAGKEDMLRKQQSVNVLLKRVKESLFFNYITPHSQSSPESTGG